MTKKQHSRRVPAPVLWAAGLAAAILAVCLWCLRDPFPRLEAAGFRIPEEQYRQAMYRARNDVLSAHAAAGISLTDWDGETALGDPCRMVTDRALEILTEYYAVSTLAVERGYLADAGFDAMMQDLEEVNRQRQEALDAGQVITGFPHFSMDDFLDYRAANIQLQFCNDPANPENHVTEDEIRQRYEADRDTLYDQPDSVALAFLALDDAGQAQALEELRQLALEKGDLAAALAEDPRLAAFYQEIDVHPGNYGVYDRSHTDILACAAGLDSGEISQVFRQDQRLYLVQCRERTVHQYIPLEDVQSVVIQSIRESRYDSLIAARTEETQIQGDLQSLYRYTAAQLP